MKKRLWILMITGMCAAGSLGGCGTGKKTETVPETTAAETTAAPESTTAEASTAAEENTEAETTAEETTTEAFVPDYADYHEIVDTLYTSGENFDYNTYTLVDTNHDTILDLVVMCGGVVSDDDYHTEIFTLTPDGVQLLETLEYPCDWLTQAEWVTTIDDTNYERFLQ